MLDVGWTELMVLVVAAVVVVGPKDLPRLMRVVGRHVGKARAMAREFRASFEEMGRDAELQTLHREMEKVRRVDVATGKSGTIAPPKPAAPAASSTAPPASATSSPPATPATPAAPADSTASTASESPSASDASSPSSSPKEESASDTASPPSSSPARDAKPQS